MDYSNRFFKVALLSFSLSATVLSGSDAIAANTPSNAQNASNSHRVFPSVTLPEPANGEHAVGLLGARLPEVAAWYGKTTAQFAKMIREDKSVWLDKQGRVFYIEVEAENQQIPTEPITTPQTSLNEQQTFLLHSKPDADRVIFLDFDGHVTTGRQWNTSYNVGTITSPAYNTEGTSASFTQAELDRIYLMWRQVAEDYAPFNVDVTTQEPAQALITNSGSGDSQFGTRVVITQDNFANCGCGGFAYVGVFNYVGDRYKPAFVFNSSVVGAGEAISHEVGHNLGLWHDGQTDGTGYYTGHGSGVTGWAPIMGVGYYQQLVQWSMDTYPLANEPADDINDIQYYGAPLIPDDHVDGMNIVNDVTAMTVTTNGTTDQLDAFGLIHLSSDQDMFKFDAAVGSYSISIQPDDVSPNLDIEASLYDSGGALLQTDNVANILSASLDGSFASDGTYFLKIDGVGKGDPLNGGYPDYGSLGQYIISATVQSPSNLQGPTANISTSGYLPDYAPTSVYFSSAGSTDDLAIVSYSWLFGDGTGETTSSPAEDPTHEYLAPGEYIASLTVTDSDGLSAQDSVAVSVLNRVPVVAIAASPLTGQAPLEVTFGSTGSKDDDPQSSINFDWDFGDGTSSTEAKPTHIYTAAGDYTATLTVMDNLGASDTANIAIDVEAPAFINQLAYGEIFTAGTVSGNYHDSALDSGSSQTITERQSGGKKKNRYSYLTHTWLFSIASGSSVEIHLDASMSNSPDDQMILSYSLDNGANYIDFAALLSDDSGHYSTMLPQGVSGEVRVRVKDSDQNAENIASFDSIAVSNLYIRSETDASLTNPVAPSGLVATPVSSSQIDLNWTDNSSDESAFHIERSLDNINWNAAGTVSADTSSYSDTGLAANTDYYHRVYASNGAGNSEKFTTGIATKTPAASELNLTAIGRKDKGVKHIDLTWAIYPLIDVYLDDMNTPSFYGTDIEAELITTPYEYDIDTGIKGGGSHKVKVCNAGGGDCSQEVTVYF